jgi:hypothetical protein
MIVNGRIYLQHKRRLLPPPGRAAEPLSDAVIGALLRNLEPLYHTFSPELIEAVRKLDEAQLAEFYEETVDALRRQLGAHVAYKPMYPGFPRQVMAMSSGELYLRAIYHYLTNRVWPVGDGGPRPLMGEGTPLKVLELGTEEEFGRIFTNLAAANGSISEDAKKDITWFIQTYGDNIAPLLPARMPIKENQAFILAQLLRHTTLGADLARATLTTATDVLRLAVGLSGGDVSLAAPTKFAGYPRRERRLLLELLEACGETFTEDMRRFPEPWKRLGERLHPGEFAKRYPRAYAAFSVLRDDTPYRGFQAQVECAIEAGNVAAALKLLARRPGYLARRLDQLLRQPQANPADIARTFRRVAGEVSTPVLLQVMTHFQYRDQPRAVRPVFPKGSVAKVQALSSYQPPLPEGISAEIAGICRDTLLERFATLPPLGTVYVDEALRRYLVPFSQRSASKALRTLTRGSRLPMGQGRDTVRFFLWWKEGLVNGTPTGRVDIDLSAVMYDADWRYLEHVSFTRLRSENYQAVHSGDIVSAPEGACEFIDLHMPSIRKHGGRYVVAALFSYSRQPFCNLPECFGGWMLRAEPGSGEIFEPRTVENKVDIAADTRTCLPVILDLEERQVIWTDLALNGHPAWNTLESNAGGMTFMGLAMTNLRKTTLYDLMELHAQARGTLVPAAEAAGADARFTENDGFPYELGRIMTDFMA